MGLLKLGISAVLGLGVAALVSACAGEKPTDRQAREAIEPQVNFGEDPQAAGVQMTSTQREAVAKEEVQTIQANLNSMDAHYGVNLSDESSAQAGKFDWSKLSTAQREDVRARLNTVAVSAQSSEGLRKNAQAWLASLKTVDGSSEVQGRSSGLDILKEAQALADDYQFNLQHPTDVVGYEAVDLKKDPNANPFKQIEIKYDWSAYNPEELARVKARLEEFLVKTGEAVERARAGNDIKLAGDYQSLRNGAKFYLTKLNIYMTTPAPVPPAKAAPEQMETAADPAAAVPAAADAASTDPQ